MVSDVISDLLAGVMIPLLQPCNYHCTGSSCLSDSLACSNGSERAKSPILTVWEIGRFDCSEAHTLRHYCSFLTWFIKLFIYSCTWVFWCYTDFFLQTLLIQTVAQMIDLCSDQTWKVWVNTILGHLLHCTVFNNTCNWTLTFTDFP